MPSNSLVRNVTLFALAASAAVAVAATNPAPSSRDTSATARAARKRWFSTELAAADSAVKARGGARAERAQLFLTWNAPYGLKRAATMRTPRCSDPSAADTLYLSFQPGRDTDTFTGFTATLLFHPPASDSLGPFWHFERSGANAGELMAEWDGVENFPGRRPYKSPGQGFLKLDHVGGAASLRMVYAVAYDQGAHVAADSIYSLGRVILRHRKLAPECDKPVAVEWVDATLAFALKDEPKVARGERFVGYGPAGSDPAARFQLPAPKAWKPRTAK